MIISEAQLNRLLKAELIEYPVCSGCSNLACIAVKTNDMRFYHKLLKLSQNSSLKISFFSESQQILEKNYDLIITTLENTDNQLTDRMIYLNYNDLNSETIPTLIGMIARNHTPRFQKLLIGIDPGKHIGIAAICDGMILSAQTIVLGQLIKTIEKFILSFPAENIFIRIGDQPPQISGMIFNNIFENFQPIGNIKLEIVKEAATNVKDSSSRHTFSMDEKAAITIGFREGQHKTHMVRNQISPGRVKEIQKWSRELSGNLTLDSSLAESVAKGKISLQDALKEKVGTNKRKKEI